MLPLFGFVGSGSAALPTIDYSLRFNAASSQYLSYTFGSPTSNTSWALSLWVKRSTLSVLNPLFYASSAAIVFKSTDVLELLDNGGASVATSSSVYRDPTAHGHLFVRSNGTNIKAYWNGTEAAATLSMSPQPAINSSTPMRRGTHNMYIRNGKRFNPDVAFTAKVPAIHLAKVSKEVDGEIVEEIVETRVLDDQQFPAGWVLTATSEQLAQVGIEQRSDPVPQPRPDDRFFIVTDNGDGSFAAVPRDLAPIRAQLKADIDRICDNKRQTFVSPGSLVTEEHRRAYDEAVRYKVEGGAVPAAIQTWATIKGWTPAQAADDIITTRNAWMTALDQIRDVRLTAKAAIDAATTPEAIKAVVAQVQVAMQ